MMEHRYKHLQVLGKPFLWRVIPGKSAILKKGGDIECHGFIYKMQRWVKDNLP